MGDADGALVCAEQPAPILEAMAAGLPVVAARSGGSPELIGDEGAGVLVEPNRPDALAIALEEVLLGHAQRTVLAERGLTRAREQFSMAGFVENMMCVYQELLSDASPRTLLRCIEHLPRIVVERAAHRS